MKLLSGITYIIKKIKIGDTTAPVFRIKDILGTLVIQTATVLLTFLSNFIVAKLFGASVYGTFTYLFTCMSVLANIALLGFNTLLTREAAIYSSRLEWGGLKGLMKIATFAVIAACAILITLALSLFQTFDFFSQIGDMYLFQLSLIALPLFALILLYQSALQGLHKILASQLPEKIIKPFVFICFVLIISSINKSVIDIKLLIWLNTISFGFGFIYVTKILVKTVANNFHDAISNYESNKWIKSASYFLIIGVVQIVNSRVDILLLGAWKGNKEVGIYNIAARLSDFITMSLLIINTVIAPAISRLYYLGQKQILQKLITVSAKMALLLSLPLILFLVFGGRWVLSLFGAEFLQGYVPMLIMVAAQIINVASGSVGNILIMTGNEKYAFISLLTSCLLNVCLNILLISYWGMYGTATAVAMSIVTWNGLMLFFVRKKTQIYPTAFGIF